MDNMQLTVKQGWFSTNIIISNPLTLNECPDKNTWDSSFLHVCLEIQFNSHDIDMSMLSPFSIIRTDSHWRTETLPQLQLHLYFLATSNSVANLFSRAVVSHFERLFNVQHECDLLFPWIHRCRLRKVLYQQRT